MVALNLKPTINSKKAQGKNRTAKRLALILIAIS